MIETNSSYLRPMLESDLQQVLAWRNHPDIRRYMYTQHEITLSEHTEWFKKACNDSNHHMLIFELDNIASGYVNIKKINQGHIAEWGFYIAPNAEKGTGKKLGVTALRYAFQALDLHKVCGQALGYNTASIGFHKSLGFIKEGTLRDQFFDNTDYHDVVHFGLLASEWKTKEKEL